MSKEDKYNPNDPAFLASRALDESLTNEQRELLNDLNDEAESFRSVDDFVKSLRDEKIDIDWATFQQTIQDRITSEYDDAQLDRVDELVQGATELPDSWNEKRFTQGVLQKIESTSQVRHPKLRWMKAMMPLAAAAAIALAVTMMPWQDSTNAPTSIVSIGPSIHLGHRLPLKNAVALVSFRHEPIAADETASRSRVSFVSIGSGSMAQSQASAPPL